jgi:molybdenum cofactor guanylyltransferase
VTNDGAAGIVLAGGRSSRMGEPKSALEWHGSTMLRRTAALLARTVSGPVVVVRAPGQELPDLPAGIEVVADPVEGRGPLQGIATGLAAVEHRVPVAFVCSTDLPLLHPAFVRRVLRELTPDLDVVLPVARGHQQPLAAAYRTALASHVAALIAAGRMRPGMLFAEVRVLRPDEHALLADPELAAADPELDSLFNVNEPADYRLARDRPAPQIAVRFGAACARVRAATLGAAAAAVGAVVGGPGTVGLNGVMVACDPQLPLAAGDEVTFAP